MEEVLNTVALFTAIDYAVENQIDVSGSHIQRRPRTFTYDLVRDADNCTMVTVCFRKGNRPLVFKVTS